MTKITSTQTSLLEAVAKADGGQIETPSEVKLKTVVAALLKRGYVISLPRPDGPSWLLITEAGRAVVGIPSAPSKPAASPNAKAARAAAGARAKLGPAPLQAQPKGKLGILVSRLRQPQGVGIDELVAATGWQAHSVRGAISGALKKKLGLTITSEKTDAGRIYRIVEGVGG